MTSTALIFRPGGSVVRRIELATPFLCTYWYWRYNSPIVILSSPLLLSCSNMLPVYITLCICISSTYYRTREIFIGLPTNDSAMFPRTMTASDRVFQHNGDGKLQLSTFSIGLNQIYYDLFHSVEYFRWFKALTLWRRRLSPSDEAADLDGIRCLHRIRQLFPSWWQ